MASANEEKPTPPVPPSEFVEIPEDRSGTRVLESERVGECDACEWGTVHEKKVQTGRKQLATWSREHFDPDEYQLSTMIDQTEIRVECDYCGAGYTA